MPDALSLHGLAAKLLPARYSARYMENLAADLGRVLLPGENKECLLEQFHVPLHFQEVAPVPATAPAASARAMDIWDVLFRAPRLALVGEPGAGKTITLRHVATTLAQGQMPETYVRRLTFLHQGRTSSQLLPIYADLGQLDKKAGDWAVALAGALAQYGFPGATDFLRTELKEGKCLLLLDGSDALTTAELRTRLDELLVAYPKVQVVLATRRRDSAAALTGWMCFELQPFSASDTLTFIDRRLGKDSPAAQALLQVLERSRGLRSLAGNPLLLSVLTWASSTAQTSPLPQRGLYERCLQVLLEGGRTTVESDAHSALDRETRDRALQEIGYRFHVRRRDRFERGELAAVAGEVLGQWGHSGKEGVLLTLLQGTQLFRRQDEGAYTFLRLALQEFLTARVVAETGRLPEVVGQYVRDPWWHEVIVLAAALQEDAAGVVSALLAQGTTEKSAFLAARCAAEVPTVAPELKEKLRDSLLQTLESGDEANWQAAAVCIAALSGQRVRDYFLSMLKEGSAGERERAAWVMGRVGTPEWAMAPLLGALDRTRPWELRRRAARALGQLRDKRAAPALLETLRDEEEQVASEAAMALSAVGEATIPALIQALGSDQRQVRRLAIQALGKMGDRAWRPLVNTLQAEKQSDDTVRGAAEALGLLGDAQVIPYLTPLLRSRGGELADSAARALAAIGAPAVQPLIEALPTHSAELALRGAIVNALVAIGEPSIPPLIQALNNPSTPVRNASEEALTRIGSPATQALVEALRAENWDLRRRIAQILGHIGDKSLAEPLVQVLQDPDPGVRAKAAQILGQIGQEQAVEPLMSIVRSDPDDFVRRTAIKALGDLHAQPAVVPLIQALENEQLRDAAIPALGEIGQGAVEPLIVALNGSQDSGFQQSCIKALDVIGMRGLFEKPDLFAVAKAYALLFTEKPALEQMVALLHDVGWWKFGEELHQAFSTVQVLLQAQNLRDVAQCAETLAWVEHVENPFRPAIKKILWDLNSVVQSVRLYLADSRREGQRDAMLSAINAITETKKAIDDQLLGFERKPFADVVEGWQHLMDEAIQNLRGRAQLEIVPLRADLPMDGTSPTAMIVFRLTNLGDSAARNLSVTLKRSGRNGFEAIGEATQQLYPLGSGMQRDVEFWIKPMGGKEASYVFEVMYDDDEGTGHFYPTSGQLRFFVVGDEYRPIPISPYVMGPPVKTQHMFYGRRDVFDWVAENISGVQQENILILHGERRMGKTSILYQLLERPPSPQHLCVFFSLELAITTSLGDFFYDMATAIQEDLARRAVQVPEPSEREFLRHTQRAVRRFLDTVEVALGERRLLIMIDEIDILIAKVEEQILSADAFHLMRGIMQHSDKVAFIVTGAYRAREMLKDNKSILFNIARSFKISYLNEKEAEALIVEPVAGYLTYDNMVVNKILRVTACQPYFIQYICDSLVKLAQRMRKNWVYLPDIDVVLQEVIQDNTGVLQNAVYAPLSKPEQKVLAALANVTDDRTIYVPPEIVAELLGRHGLDVPKAQLLEALRALCERDLVDEKRMGQSLQYGFRMDLIRMWLRQNETLLRLSQEAKI